MKKEKEELFIKTLFLIMFAFFIFWGIFAVSTRNIEYIYDRFFSAVLMLFGFIFFKKLNLKIPIVIISIATLILHHLKLYGNVYFGFLQFDMIMHFFAGFVLSLIFFDYLKYDLNISKVVAISFLCAAGITSLSEIIEYFGYYFLGPGEGILFYGVGDFGEYADICWDIICNTLGALFGVFVGWIIKIKIPDIL